MGRTTRWARVGIIVTIASTALPARPSTPAEPRIGAFAGTGAVGYSGDGGPALEATLNDPRTVAVGPGGDVFVADTLNNVVRKVDTSGIITTVAGTGTAGEAGDGGPATSARLKWPHSLAVDGHGNLYIADSPNHRIRRVDANGVITTVAGTGRGGYGGDGGPATEARLSDPKGIALDGQGRLYIADTGNSRVRRVDASGIISTVAGNGEVGGAGDGGSATAAQVSHPRSIAVDGSGVMFISEDAEGEVSRIRRVDSSGIITRYAGIGEAGYSGDGGRADEARLNRPRGIAADASGNLYIADSDNNRIRRVDTAGVITTVAGSGDEGSDGDGGPATAARLAVPRGLAVAPWGDVFVADTFGSRIRRIAGLAPSWGPAPSSGSAQPEQGPPPKTSPRPSPQRPQADGGAHPSPPARSGYRMVEAGGRVHAFGDAAHLGDAGSTGTVDLEPSPSGDGYWTVTTAGEVSTFGDARELGDARGWLAGGEAVTSLSSTGTGHGYWLFTSRGRVLPFGDARFHGDMSGVRLNGPVLDSVPTPSGEGYYMVASDGGIFTFGDARFLGSMGDRKLNAPVQSMVPDGDGWGYWLVASDGGIFAFQAPFRGSMGAVPLNAPVTGMVRFGDGYLMAGEDGGIFNFSDRPFAGSLGDDPPSRPIVSVAALWR
jgi:sugar lactone lactonase YvrE